MSTLLTSRGSTWAWRRLRLEILERDGWVCQLPTAGGRLCGAPASHVDHLTPRSRGGDDDPTNLRASCQRCNLSRGNGLGRLFTAPPSRTW